jgi:release factor glutamine methyltransferase
MKIEQILNIFYSELKNFYTQNEIQCFIHIIFEDIFNVSKIEIYKDKNREIQNIYQNKIYKIIYDLKNYKPIQYITNKVEFYGLNFYVDENVLIPRPETEELVSIILKNEILADKKILDIGVGSGCISVSLAKNSKSQVFGIDISENALNIAKKNAENNKVNISFFEIDILNFKSLNNENQNITFDFIVSNPPYVRNLEKKMMKKNVLDFEPNLALFVEDSEPLIFYKAIANFAKEKLRQNGIIYLEINEFLANETADIFIKNNFFEVTVIKDFFKKDRFIKVIK